MCFRLRMVTTLGEIIDYSPSTAAAVRDIFRGMSGTFKSHGQLSTLKCFITNVKRKMVIISRYNK